MIGLCDCNNFFASCERVFRPELRNRPVVVLSNNDGCVIARSNEAKALGITMGVPLFQVKNIIKKHDVAVFSSNYTLYGDMSHRVMSLLRQAAPAVEVYSIDEAFMDLSGVPLEQLSDFGHTLSRHILRCTGIPVSIGISQTKTRAKIASKLCKQYPRLEGCCLMHQEEDCEKVFRKFPIDDVWGIGRRYYKRLLTANVHTAWEFANLPGSWVQQQFGVTGLRTWKELRGIPNISFEDTLNARQSICVSRSFAHEINDFDTLHRAITTFVSAASAKLRSQHCFAKRITVFIYTNRHNEHAPQSFENARHQYETPTDSTLELTETASALLPQIFRPGYGYKKAGVVLEEFTPVREVQQHLFDPIDHNKHHRLMQTLDHINACQGNNTIRLAAQEEVSAFSNRNKVSPNYTTEWDEIMDIYI